MGQLVAVYGDDQDQRRARRKRDAALLLGLALFSPWKRLRAPIAVASHDLDDYFDSVDTAMETASLSSSLKSGRPIVSSLEKLILSSLVAGFDDGGSLVGRKAGRNYLARAQADAADRAHEVSGQMVDTSKRWLKADPQNEYALSSQRADAAARYEAARAYNTGLLQSLWGAGMTKEWVTTSDHPCEELCLPNEDQGAIPVEDVFQSGDYAPLAHPNCMCILQVNRS